MIRGIVRDREAIVPVSVSGGTSRKRTVRAVVDTGYTGYTGWLTLPPALIQGLGLKWHNIGRGQLADGSISVFDVFQAEVDWDGRVRRVLVDELESTPLIGMAMLHGYELVLQVRQRGRVTISRLTHRK